MVTVTWFIPVSLIFTVPTDPEIPRLFEVKSKLTELATAGKDSKRTNARLRNSDLATYARTKKIPPVRDENTPNKLSHEYGRSAVEKRDE